MIVRPITDQAGYAAWVAERPPVIRDMIASHPPDRLYRMQSTGHRVTLHSYSEDRTVTVDITGEYNRVVFSRRVFGIPVDDLIECDPPPADEPIGDTAREAGYTDQDIKTILIPKLREQMKP